MDETLSLAEMLAPKEPTLEWFRHYTALAMSSESLTFWLESCRLDASSQLPDKIFAAGFERLCHLYLETDAVHEVNISGACRKRLLAGRELEDTSLREYLAKDGCLEEARREVLLVLDRQFYISFCQLLRKAKLSASTPKSAPMSPKKKSMFHVRRKSGPPDTSNDNLLQ